MPNPSLTTPGLDQTYELLNMFYYALYYYRKAVTLRPTDARMWCAMGSCFRKLDRLDEAIRSFERASSSNDQEGIATLQLAKLYKEKRDDVKAAECYQQHLNAQRGRPDHGDTKETADALEFLARHHLQQRQLEIASKFCSRLLEIPGEEERGKSLEREIRAMQGTSGTSPIRRRAGY